MNKILLFAGTTEGRLLAEYLDRHQVETHVCVATEYGESLLVEGAYLHIHQGRLTMEEMGEWMEAEEISIVIDATHPYAAVVSENIRQACDKKNRRYLRLLRGASEDTKDCILVESVAEAVDFLKETTGNILVTTGSKELGCFTELPDFQERVYARVLSTPEVAASCAAMGFQGRHLICMQGPFSEALNTAMLSQIDAKWMVTKESGKNGGYEEKVRAARTSGARVVLIGRPKEPVKGMDEMEIRALLAKKLKLPAKPVITLAGIGMGSTGNRTQEVEEACQEAELLIGAGRMLQSVDTVGKAVFEAYKPEEIAAYIKAHPEYEKVTILLSGDVGFYSGAKKLLQVLEGEEIRVYSGISSMVYLCGKLHTSWEDVYLISLHGRNMHAISAIRTHRKVFALTGKDAIQRLCEELIYYGMGQVTLSVGEELSYEGERIRTGTAEELAEETFAALNVVLVENPNACMQAGQGIADEEFLREKVPMTKEEVRAVSIAKLHLKEDSVIYDVGAGTGSVSVEMALRAWKGEVYAIEKKAEAVALIRRNQQKFAVDNLQVVEGLAPDALQELPTPSHAFIGGSAGNMMDILKEIFMKNPQTRIVVNAIALETVAETMRCMKELNVEDTDIAVLSVGKSKEIGNYHMMMGQNPVYVISFTGGR